MPAVLFVVVVRLVVGVGDVVPRRRHWGVLLSHLLLLLHRLLLHCHGSLVVRIKKIFS